ncbi:Uma2 family endonuclease [Nocardia sp. NBC_01503]|uniref:Uma2 family endonuclease n=1 Tax=Nocardia sp. NBC_01503 TaxID=2975997 RepID=UPI002E7BFDDF|nr:Uma2 family endonuclease [Nocardia sp. NBC_01503]WTL32967.1 Uma2 family endonuclease [Nocardia sp. NBC_01503]
MTEEATLHYHWTRDAFMRAWEAGAFDRRVELVEGEVWPVVLGDWHGETIFRVGELLRHPDVIVTGSTLPTCDSLPDPDCWIRRKTAEPVDTVGTRLTMWASSDVLLVVEVSDETVMADLGVKERLYGRAGYQEYWVVTQSVIYKHTAPTSAGYRFRQEFRSGDRIALPYADTDIAVEDLLNPA